MNKINLLESMEFACQWLTDIAQIKTDELTGASNKMAFQYNTWKGAIRGEYSAAKDEWDFFCPIWHTGQAVKALVNAFKITKNESYFQAARLGAGFITNNQIFDPVNPDFGLILAFEDISNKVNTSAIIECLDGLIYLAELEKNDELWERIVAAGDFVINRMYMPEIGLFRDMYDPITHVVELSTFFETKNNWGGRPLLDDAIFLKLYRQTGKQKYLDVNVRVAERLVADQRPKGNWLDYSPCIADKMIFHPRHTYWWGMPLLETYRQTKRQVFLETAIDSGKFTLKAMRSDGGWIRGLYLEGESPLSFNTDCFNHATSGSACAAIFFMELYKETRDAKWIEGAELALSYCMGMQVREATNPNMSGVIIEKVMRPDGTDRNPYHIRDLGTIFFIQAAAKYLNLSVKSEGL